MKPYIEKLKTYLAEHPPDYGDCDAYSVLEMLYTYYSQYNRLDTPQIKSDFETLYQQLTGKSLRVLDNIIDTVTTICGQYKKSGFAGDIKAVIQLTTKTLRRQVFFVFCDIQILWLKGITDYWYEFDVFICLAVAESRNHNNF